LKIEKEQARGGVFFQFSIVNFQFLSRHGVVKHPLGCGGEVGRDEDAAKHELKIEN